MLVPDCMIMVLAVSPYSLLRELTGTLVLGVTDQFDNAALIWCKTCVPRSVSNSSSGIGLMCQHTADFANDLTAELSALGEVALRLFVHQHSLLPAPRNCPLYVPVKLSA